MLSQALVLSALLLLARAALTPTGPGPTDTFRAGSSCSISWTPDPTGEWTNVTIQLMSGQNMAMLPVLTVLTALDGTSAAPTSYSYLCPEVEPYSAIYFYEFSQPGADSPVWTSRFTIAAPDGTTVPPEYPTQPSGDAIPWGTGQLAFSTPTASNTTSLTNGTLTLPELDQVDGNSTLLPPFPTTAPTGSGMVRVVQPTATTVLTWVVIPLSANASGNDTDGPVGGKVMDLASETRELGRPGAALVLVAAVLVAAGHWIV